MAAIEVRASSRRRLQSGKWELGLRWLAGIALFVALALNAVHLVTPGFPVSEQALSLARNYLIASKERSDFDFLAAQPIWEKQRLRTLLEHVELAHYSRTLVNWQVSDEVYREAVLNPLLDDSATNQLQWRREL